ncbi:MAG TPA: efflux RND transporter periplasmic adaptor subunit [Terracidiphilus sp.]|jgi:Cu(I)/Ag(I) efflux system membrane fusion protein
MKRYSAISVGVLLLLCLGFAVGRFSSIHNAASPPSARRVLYYVDPMHPAYRSDKPGIAPDCGMALEPVYEGEDSHPHLPLQPGAVALSPERQRLIGISVETVGKSSGMHIIRTTGRVIPDDSRFYRIQAGLEGWVESLRDTPPGTLVKRGDVLATLYGPDIRTASVNYINFMSGIERLRLGMPDSDMKSFDESKRVSEEQLRLLGMGDQEIKQVGETHRITSSLNLVSPGDGIVLARSVSPNQRFEKGTELFRIANLGKVFITADVHGSDGDLRPGMKVKVSVPGMGKTIEARVSQAMPLFDETSRTLKVRLEADNPSLLLRPDMFVDVEIETTAPPGLSIPADAVLDSGLRKIVYLETGEGVFEPRPVQISGAFGDRVIVTGGINEGDRVVVAGNFLLDSESRMRASSLPPESARPSPEASLHSASLPLARTPHAAAGPHGEARDPVCGMTLKPAEIAFQENYRGQVYSFCSDSCRRKFLADPARYGDEKAAVMKAPDQAAHPHD